MAHVEWVVWKRLRQRPGGLKWRRQHPLPPYVLDFCCLEKRVDLELDGNEHDHPDNRAADDRRDDFVRRAGFKVPRVTNLALDNDLDRVIDWVTRRALAHGSENQMRPSQAPEGAGRADGGGADVRVGPPQAE